MLLKNSVLIKDLYDLFCKKKQLNSKLLERKVLNVNEFHICTKNAMESNGI